MLNKPESERERLLEIAQKLGITEEQLFEGARRAVNSIGGSLIRRALDKGGRITFPGLDTDSPTGNEETPK